MKSVRQKRTESCLSLARSNGKYLCGVKKQTPRGQWLNTISHFTDCSIRQAQKYMKIYKYWSLLPKKNSMTIDEAYNYINKRV